MAGAIDLFSGSSSITGTNLFQVDKNPLNELDQGVEDVIGQQATGTGGTIWSGIQGIIDAVLGIQPNSPESQALGAGFQDIISMFNNVWTFLGELNPTSPTFNPVAAIETFITTMLKPSNLLAMLVTDATTSAGVTGFIPLENLAMSEIAAIVGGAQAVIDAILASVGVPAGSGTTTQVNTYFTNFLAMVANPALISGTFNPVTAVETFITAMINPTNLLAPLVSGLVPGANIPGLDASKITSGIFPQSMVNITSIAASIVTGILGAGQIPGLDATKIISGIFTTGQIPSLPASQITSGTFLATLIPGLDASKITSGTFSLPFVPSVQTLIDAAFQAMFGGSSTGNAITTFKTALQNIPGGNIISSILAAIVPALDASKITTGIFGTGQIPSLDASKIVSGLLNAAQIPGLDATKITTGAFAQSMVTGLPAALASMLTATSPLNALNLYNQVSSDLIGMLPVSHIGITNPNLLSSAGFDAASSINSPGWSWNGSDGHTTPGCAQATANGSQLTLVSSSPIQVVQNQQLNISAWVKYTGLTATAGANALRINVAAYLGSSGVSQTMVAWIGSPSGASSNPSQNNFVQMTGTWTVPAGVDNILIQLQITPAATTGTVEYDDASCTKTGLMSGSWMTGISGTVASDMQSMVDQIFQASAPGAPSGNPLSSILTAMQAIPFANVLGVLGPANVGASLGSTVDSIWQGFTGLTNTGISLGLLANAANQTATTASNAQTVGHDNSMLLVNRAVTKPGYHAIDPTADAVFHITNINGSSPTTVPVASATSAIGMLSTPDGGVKESIIWLGSNTTNVTAMYVNIYKLNTTTGALTNVFASPNIISSVSNSLTWNYYNLPSANWITTAQGDWYAVEMVTVGTGSYALAGMPSHWLPANGATFPRQLGASRATASTPAPPPTISAPTYAANMPWFALSGSAGASTVAPQTTEYAVPGSYSYPIPPWCNSVDVIVLGAGGGGAGCSSGFWGEGGNPGAWNATTLVKGIQIPTTTTTISVTVGAGGAGSPNGNGAPGGPTSASATGWSGISVLGGGGGRFNVNNNTNGLSPGNETFDGITYYGGATQTAYASNGSAPGGGGSGAVYVTGFGYPNSVGGNGAPGAVWIMAYQ